MAKTKTSTIADMTTGKVADDTRLYFAVMSDEFTVENGVVADPDDVKLAEKVFVQTRFVVDNDQDSSKDRQNGAWTQVTVDNYSGLGAGFLGDLKEIFDTDRTTLGLDPA